MNAKAIQLSAAVALGLGIASTSLGAAAAMDAPQAKMHLMESGSLSGTKAKVIQLGTIHVTRADMEGAREASAPSGLGSTAFLGSVQVTPKDSSDARAAALLAKRSGAVYLGSITVTADDSEDARFAKNEATRHGSAYLGSIQVTPAKTLFASGLLAVERFVGSHPTLVVIGTLVFERAGG
jgi:hypothetical protein